MLVTAISFLVQATPWTPLCVRRGRTIGVDYKVRCEEIQEETTSNTEEQILVWQFSLEEFDIGFEILENGSLIQENTRYTVESTRTKSSYKAYGGFFRSDSDPSDQKESNSNELFTEEENIFEGTIDTAKVGSIYTLRWDNSYSFVRRKNIKYRVRSISKKAFKAAEIAAKEYNERYEVNPEEEDKMVELPELSPQNYEVYLRRCQFREAALNSNKIKLLEELESCVTDVVSIFMTNPDVPLHEGSIRSFILAFEAILRYGIKTSYLINWPEEPYFRFLLETKSVLRDDYGLVKEVKALSPSESLCHIGWTLSRSFLFLALNKNILHRSFENLVKRRTLIENTYEPHALLYDYGIAKRIGSFLSALHGVKFDLVPTFDESEILVDEFPPNLLQCCPNAEFIGATVDLKEEKGTCLFVPVTINEDDYSQMQNVYECSVVRYALNTVEFVDVQVGRGSCVKVNIQIPAGKTILVLQVQVISQDILLAFATQEEDLMEPISVAASDQSVECILKMKESVDGETYLKLDNSFSLVRSKTIRYRCVTLSEAEYDAAWQSCVEMAQSISWKYTSKKGSARAANYLKSLRQLEEQQMQRHRQDSIANDPTAVSSRPSLIYDPVSFLASGIGMSVTWYDVKTPECSICMAPFSFFCRQHNCASCQSYVCVQCSRHYVQLIGRTGQFKVCDRCFIKEKDKEKKKRLENGDEQKECAEYTALRQDITMAKYFKMLAFGVPASAVAQKMTQDEMPAEKIATFSAGPSGTESGTGRQWRRQSSEGDGDPRRGSAVNRRASSFRKVHWTSLESEKASDSIWTRVTARRKTAPITLSAKDFEDLEFLFGEATRSAADKKRSNSGDQSKKSKFSALDSRRSNNISIALSQFKSSGGIDQIIQAIKDCDFEFLTIERLSSLLEIAPNAIEVKRYSNFRGSRSKLETAEKFLVEMCKIPRVSEKIEVLLFIAQYTQLESELRHRVNIITKACYQILHSERLARCFELVLAIGNMLNAGSEQAGARGITLESLLKLSETKAIDQSMTLLQFIINLIHERGEGDVLFFISELSSIPEARRFSNTICMNQYKAFQRNIIFVQNELKEELANDKLLFEKEEQKRKASIEARKMAQTMPPLPSSSRPFVAKPEGPGNPSAALLSAIRQRGSSDTSTSSPSSNPLTTSGSSSIPNENPMKAALLAQIRQKGSQEPTSSTVSTETPPRPPIAGQAPLQNALMAQIRAKGNSNFTEEGAIPNRPPTNQAALLLAIRGGKLKRNSQSESSTTNQTNVIEEEFVPRMYSEHRNVFISKIKKRLVQIQTAFEEVDIEVDTMNSEWEATARYLGEGPTNSSSEYVMNLLNRFIMDVKVAKSLLFRKGLMFTSDSQSLLPRAQVGSVISTVFGPGVITALRVADRKIEVKFPWSKEGYLDPSSILQAGTIVRCTNFGVGILTSANYARGFCQVRFSFGYGSINVMDISVETTSHIEKSRNKICKSEFRVGDPVLTPFGFGFVRAITKSSDSVVAVSLLNSMYQEDGNEEDMSICDTRCGIAYVHSRHVSFHFDHHANHC